MKNKIFILFLCIVILLTSCSTGNKENNVDSSATTDTVQSKIEFIGVEEKGREIEFSDYTDASFTCESDEIILYELLRNDFQKLIENQNIDEAINNCYKKATYTTQGSFWHAYTDQDSIWHESLAGNMIDITNDFLGFFMDKTAVQSCLSQNGVSGEVEDVVLLDTQSISLVIWIKTTDSIAYIVASFSYEKECIVYKLYTQEELEEKYLAKEAELVVNGKKIKTKNPPVIYHDYADIPFSVVLEAMGKDVDWKNDTDATVTMSGEKYELKINERKFCRENDYINLLYMIVGGSMYVYPQNGELMVDSNTLYCVFDYLEEPISIKIDRAGGTVEIWG